MSGVGDRFLDLFRNRKSSSHFNVISSPVLILISRLNFEIHSVIITWMHIISMVRNLFVECLLLHLKSISKPCHTRLHDCILAALLTLISD